MAEKQTQNESDAQGSDPQADPDFFGGGDSGKASPPQPELDELEIGGKKFKLEKSAAEAFRAQQELTRSELERRDQEIRQLRTPPAPKPDPKADPLDDPQWDARFFESPSKHIKQIRQAIREEVTQELTQKYQATNAEQRFWDDFYRENAAFDRSKDDRIVKAVLAERQQELAPLPIPEAKKRLAQYTTEWLLDIHKRYAPKADPTADTVTLEGSSPPTRRAVKQPEAQEPTRISDWIREKKNFRREAAIARSTRKEAS